MRIYDHFGHLMHAHDRGAWIAITIGVFVAVGMSVWVVLFSRKDSED